MLPKRRQITTWNKDNLDRRRICVIEYHLMARPIIKFIGFFSILASYCIILQSLIISEPSTKMDSKHESRMIHWSPNSLHQGSTLYPNFHVVLYGTRHWGSIAIVTRNRNGDLSKLNDHIGTQSVRQRKSWGLEIRAVGSLVNGYCVLGM